MSHIFTISETAAKIRKGQLHSTELVEQCLAKIDAYDDCLHAWVVVDEGGARREAEHLDQEAARGHFRGPLHGIPIGIKDIIDVANMPTRAGSPLRAQHLALVDAPIVAALRHAGAVILGKTVTVEFACFDPSPTLNPWDPQLQHTPGGSSSGSAVALAMGMCLGSLGTQTGGSLVRPSSYCGTATCKPTFGTLSREGVVPVSFSLDHPGPMARSVGDLTVMLQCLQSDGNWAGVEEVPNRPPRIGRLVGFFDEADSAVLDAIEDAIKKFRQAGAVVETIPTPESFHNVRAMHRCLMAVEAAAYHRHSFAAHREAYGPMISGLLDEGLRIPGVDYLEWKDAQRRFATQIDALFDTWRDRVDFFLCPSTDTTAPATLTTTGTPKFQAPWSCSGVPVVSMPCALASDGMPAAVQLIGPRHSEPQLLHAAEWCERQLDFQAEPPLLGS
jgi:aspartyl-tRNA(Asn)/glutamyl-tRNA(Gln) amidotransferase subunit A